MLLLIFDEDQTVGSCERVLAVVKGFSMLFSEHTPIWVDLCSLCYHCLKNNYHFASICIHVSVCHLMKHALQSLPYGLKPPQAAKH